MVEHLGREIRVSALQVEVESLDGGGGIKRLDLCSVDLYIRKGALPPGKLPVPRLLRDQAVLEYQRRGVCAQKYRNDLLSINFLHAHVQVLGEFLELRMESSEAFKVNRFGLVFELAPAVFIIDVMVFSQPFDRRLCVNWRAL